MPVCGGVEIGAWVRACQGGFLPINEWVSCVKDTHLRCPSLGTQATTFRCLLFSHKACGCRRKMLAVFFNQRRHGAIGVECFNGGIQHRLEGEFT